MKPIKGEVVTRGDTREAAQQRAIADLVKRQPDISFNYLDGQRPITEKFIGAGEAK